MFLVSFRQAHVVGVAEKALFLFSDGAQIVEISGSQLTGSLLGGMAIFSSSQYKEEARQSLTDCTILINGDDIPAFWYGNIGFETYVTSSKIAAKSGILAIANFSQITQGFDL